MEILTVLITDTTKTANLIKSALAKEKYFLQIGVEKTKARILEFEQKYEATLNQIIDSE